MWVWLIIHYYYYHLVIDSMAGGVVNWDRPHERADGISISTYERKYQSSEHHGDPIADAYAIVTRPNNCVLVVADGVNWGSRPRIAARAALLGCIEHIHSKLFDNSATTDRQLTTQDVFHHILLSFDCAQREIIAKEGTTTTLTVAIVIELKPHPRVNSRWGLCVVSVGDSPCFLYNQATQTVCEVTAAAHMGIGRDPRDAGGCLGANCGDLPDLGNLVCCFMPVYENDIVFITSDGISDNFDIVSLKKATPISDSSNSWSSSPNLPQVSPEERQVAMTTAMAGLLGGRSRYLEKDLSAQELVHILVSYAVDITSEKRMFLEQVWEKTSDPALTPRTRREMERSLSLQSKRIPGKLDHTSIVAYQIAELRAVPVTIATAVQDQVRPERKNTSPHPSVSRRVTPMDDHTHYQVRDI